MTFYDRLEKVCRAKGMTVSFVCDKLGISRSLPAYWRRAETTPAPATVRKIAEYLNIPLGYFFDEEEPTKDKSAGVKIPVLGHVAAGIPIEAVEDIIDYEEISRVMAASGEYFALRIEGHSMMPRISDGDVVIVRRQPSVENDEIAIVMVDGENATCKKIKRMDEGIMLIPLNPAYSPMFYNNREIKEKPVTILGKVVELRAKF